MIIVPNENGFEAWSKDLEGIKAGVGKTRDEARDAVKENIRQRIQKLKDDGSQIPFVDIVGYLPMGVKPLYTLVRLTEPPVETA